ncbi:hypothetical protein A3N51_05675 [Enterobacter kobei]|uniref:hypothetical protein n=1 Tax=Enterobacter kobei TaxID=208224 RepID=UPI0007B3C68E|nr:hypothetical protein [Enterobacter kobei]KZQ03941.1 hypothetical protein A3N51_05675 [Enterobacter kobei]
MTNGKRLFILALILACFSAQANDAGRLQQALRPWHPLAVTRHHDTMTVILNEDRVTPARYEEVIGKGLCAGIWSRQAPSRYLASVSQVQVLNRFHTRGYVLMEPGALCNRIRQATGQRAWLILQSYTLLY